MSVDRYAEVAARAELLNQRLGGLPPERLLRELLTIEFPGRIAVVSSFGAESAALLHMVATIDPATPVVVIDTGKLFEETVRYRDELTGRLGLSDVRIERPDPIALAVEDPDGTLWSRDPDRCCHLRKVLPLPCGLEGVDAWITGRKRFQSATRSLLPVVESDGPRIKANPLAGWTYDDVDAYYDRHALPRRPLFDAGFLSIGCAPCTRAVLPGEDARAGRWAGMEKTECGLHGRFTGGA